jgi:hypothetical protein
VQVDQHQEEIFYGVIQVNQHEKLNLPKLFSLPLNMNEPKAPQTVIHGAPVRRGAPVENHYECIFFNFPLYLQSVQ